MATRDLEGNLIDYRAKITLEEFVARAKAVHGDRYSNYELIGGKKFKAICPKHGEFTGYTYQHTKGTKCIKCGFEDTRAAALDTLENYVDKARAIHGDTYEYIKLIHELKKPTKLVAVCKEHGEFTILARSHIGNQHSGCPKCGLARRLLTDRYNFDWYVEQANKVHDNKYTYIELVYTYKSKTKVRAICPQHGEFLAGAKDHLNNRSKCNQCSVITKAISKRKTLDEILDLSGLRDLYTDYELDYSDPEHSKISAVCSKHGKFTKRTDNFMEGSGCPECGIHSDRETGYTLEEYVKLAKEAHNNEYEYGRIIYSSEIKSEKYQPRKIEVICQKHGVWTPSMSGHLNAKNKCPRCNNLISNAQAEIHNYLQSLGVPVYTEQAVGSSRKRWDIVSHEHKVAIEFDGLWWHSSKFVSSKDLFNKRKLAVDEGYRQINIFEDEWENNQDIIKAILRNTFGISNDTKVYARKCSVRTLETLEAVTLLESHHIQGYKNSSKYIGLIYDGKVVACLGYELRASGRGNKPDPTQAEITRYAASCKVLGGFSKLLDHMLKVNHEIRYTYTFSDNRIFTGEMYKTCGFKCVGELAPDYYYVKGIRRFNKAGFQKSKAASWAKIYDETLTEKELAELNGYYQIFDCGKKKWELIVK